MSERIFITGSNGFIGSALTERLGQEGIPFDKFDRNQDIPAASSYSHIIHLAALTRGDEKEIQKANVNLTLRILEKIAESNPKPNLIFSSTFAVYGIQNDLLEETSPTLPRNIYGKTKLEAENLIREFSEKHNINSIILRFSNVYGQGMRPYSHSVVATFFDQIKKGNPLTINSDGNQKRDFIHISDVINALIKSLKWDGKGVQIINICSQESISMNELALEIAKVFKKQIVISYPRREEEDLGFWIGSNQKAKEILHWTPEINLENGIRRYYEEEKDKNWDINS